MVKHREKNKFQFLSFSDQIGAIKVVVRRLKQIDGESSEEFSTHTFQSLQHWREINCSEQFVKCYGKLNGLTESLAQLLHHRESIMEIIFESLGQSLDGNTSRSASKTLGCDAILDVLSHLFLDLQQDLYPHIAQIIVLFQKLLLIQDAHLISCIFKTLGHIFKTSWREMLADFSSVFDMLIPLLKPPTKYYVTQFTAESFAFLIRKHPSPEKVVELMESRSCDGDELMKPIAALLFETVRGIQYKFNTFAEPYLSVMMKKTRESATLQSIYSELLKLIVTKINKSEISMVWKGLLDSLMYSVENIQNSQIDCSELVDYVVVVLSWIDIILVGGRHTYLVSGEDVWSTLVLLCPSFAQHQSLEQKFSETLIMLINANNQLKRYLKDEQSQLDVTVIKSFATQHHSIDVFKSFVEKLSEMPEFSEKYSDVLFTELQNVDTIQYSAVLAGLVIRCEAGNVLSMPIFAVSDNFKHKLNAILHEASDDVLVFNLLKILQSCGPLNNSSGLFLTELASSLLGDKKFGLYLQTVKCCISAGVVSKTFERTKILAEFVDLLAENFRNHVFLQTMFFLLQKCSNEDKQALDGSALFAILKENILDTTTTIRYLSLEILSLLSDVMPDALPSPLHISSAISAEATPLSLETYRDKLMHCSQLRFSEANKDSEFRLRYLIGCLQWPLKPIWDGITKLIIEFVSNDAAIFWTIFSAVLSSVYSKCAERKYVSNEVECIYYYEQKISSSDFSHSGPLLKNILPITFRVSLWNLLANVSEVAEPKSRFIVPFILQFREEYERQYGYKTQNIALQERVTSNEPGPNTTEKGHMNDELRAMLKLLRQFTNAVSLYRSTDLYSMYTDLLSSKQSDIQKLALDCILTYKNKTLVEYKDELELLVNDVTFRDQLSKLSVAGAGSVLKVEDRTEVFPILLRIMFGKMGSRIGHAKGKSGSKQRQGIVLRYLEACSEEEVRLFFQLTSERFGVDLITPGSEFSLEVTPLAMQTSYLRLICQMLSVLREEQTVVFADEMISVVLALLRSTQHCLAHRDLVLPHTVTPLKSLRALSINTLTKVFNTFPLHDLTSHRERVNEVVLDSNLPGLPSESLQSCSPLLLFIDSCSQHRIAWLNHTYDAQPVLSYVISLLGAKGAVSTVTCRVFTIISTLLKNTAAGVELLKPFIRRIVDFIYTTLVMLKKSVPDKKMLRQALDLLSQLSVLITELGDVTSCSALVRSLLHVLEGRIVWRSGDVVNALNTVTRLAVYVGDTALHEECYSMCNMLLGYSNDRFSREALCRVMQQLGHPSALILCKLHAWNTKVVDEPDFDTRLEGYREMTEEVKSGKCGVKTMTPWVQTALYTVFNTDEMALRDSASQALLATIQQIDTDSELYHPTVISAIGPSVQRALSNKDEIFRKEAVILLHKLVQQFPGTSPWQHLAQLTDPDPEIDFFNNITHIQTHRRTRAVTKLRGVTEGTDPDVLWNFFLPLTYPVFSLKGNKYHNTITEGLATLTAIGGRLPWPKFKKLLNRSLKELTANVEDKTLVKVVGAVLAGFHEEVKPSSKILRSIKSEILPQLMKLLTKNSAMPDRTNKMSITYDQDQVSLQAPIAIAIVNLVMQLPEDDRQSRLPPVLLRVGNTLRSRSMEVRDVARQTLSTIANSLGPLYLSYILSELKSALAKGYQLHVLSHTIHHLLLHMTLEPGQLDTTSLSLLVEISVDGLVGRTASDRERDDKKSSLPEAKQCYSTPVFQMCASKLTVSQIDTLMGPVKKMVLEVRKSKARTAVEDALRGIVTGFLGNCLITPTVAMVFCRDLLKETAELEKPADTPVQEKYTRPDIYVIPAAPKRDGVKPKTARLSDNSHMLRQLPLQLLTTLLKRKRVSVAEHSGLLDPLIGSLTSLLASPSVGTQVLVVKCFSQLFEQSVLLPSLCEAVPQLTKFSFEILRNNSRSTNSGHMLELIFSSFKILTVILREYKDFTLTETQTQTLLQYIADDIHNRNRQSTAFTLLKSILSRDLVHPDIPDLLSRVLEMSIVGQSQFVRTQARQVYLHYLLHYPLGKKIRPLFIALTQQLEYTHKDGRLSALELLHALISKLPPDLLKEYFLVFFLSLSRMLVADDEAECRRAAGVTVQDLVGRGDEGLREKVWGMTAAWLSDPKTKHRYLAVQLIELLSDSVSEKKAVQFTDQLCRLVQTYSASSDDTTATTLRDQILYRSVITLLKLKQPLSSLQSSLESLLLYPHQWVRLAASQLLGQLLSKHDPALFKPSAEFSEELITVLIQCCLKQLNSQNILPDHALQLTKNLVWFTAVCLRHSDAMSPSHLIHKLVTCANVEASQNPTSVVKRSMVLKWVGALAASLPPELVLPHLSSLVVPVNRELKTESSNEQSQDISELTNEVLNLLRGKLGHEAVSQALVAAEKLLLEKKRKRKREDALSAIATPDLQAKRKIKENKAKREKRKEKFKTLKAKQFKSF